MLWPANGNWPYELRGGRADALAFLWMNAALDGPARTAADYGVLAAALGGLFVPMYVAARRHDGAGR